jgi:Polyketide cyclase / dehydrase and lipid transport
MPKVKVSRSLSSSPDEVWKTISQIDGIHRFHPGVDRSPLCDGSKGSGVGAERVCQLYDGGELHERVVAVDDGKSLDVEVVGGTLPLESAVGRMELYPRADGGTDFTMTFDFRPAQGVPAAVLQTKLEEKLKLLLAGLDEHLVSGRIIDEQFSPSSMAAASA